MFVVISEKLSFGGPNDKATFRVVAVGSPMAYSSEGLFCGWEVTVMAVNPDREGAEAAAAEMQAAAQLFVPHSFQAHK